MALHSTLILNANAHTQSCTGDISYANIQIKWSIRELLNANNTLTLSTVSQNPNIFKLSPYSLLSNMDYEVTAFATVLNSPVTVLVKVIVSVQPSQIVARFQCGVIKYLKVGELYHIDASQSYDIDKPNIFGLDAQLLYRWSCNQIQPFYSEPCVLKLPLNYRLNSTLDILPVYSTVASLSANRVTVTVFDKSNSRSSSAYVDIIVNEVAKPDLLISTSSLSSLTSVNTGATFSLLGSIKVYQPCTASWYINDASLDLASISLTPTTKYIESGTSFFNLLLTSGVLPQRTSLTFSLYCDLVYTFINIQTNGLLYLEYLK